MAESTPQSVPAPFKPRPADPQVFFAAMLSGCIVSGIPPGVDSATWISHCKNGWRAFHWLVGWVNSGEDVKDLEATRAKEEARRLKMEEVARVDREVEEARLAKAAAAHGERQ